MGEVLHANSSDGREVWAWAERLSEHTALLDRIHRLRADIAKVGTECGDCNRWMKSRECPREWNDNGRQRGPSCSGRPCGQFSLSASSARFLADRQAELSETLALSEGSAQ